MNCALCNQAGIEGAHVDRQSRGGAIVHMCVRCGGIVGALLPEPPGGKYTCAECGSDDVEMEHWVRMNTGEVVEPSTETYCYCNACGEQRTFNWTDGGADGS